MAKFAVDLLKDNKEDGPSMHYRKISNVEAFRERQWVAITSECKGGVSFQHELEQTFGRQPHNGHFLSLIYFTSELHYKHNNKTGVHYETLNRHSILTSVSQGDDVTYRFILARYQNIIICSFAMERSYGSYL